MLKDKQKAELYHQLGQLSEAGFPITKASEAAMDARPPADQRQFLEELKRGVEDGDSLSGAAGATSENLTGLELSILQAAEEGGRVPEGFGHLARYFEMRHAARKKIRSGLIYPAILLHLAVILPAIPSAILSQDIPGTAFRTLIILFVIYAIVLVAAFIFHSLALKARTDAGTDRMLRKIPLIGKVRHRFALSRFAEVLRIQLLSGRGPRKAIDSAAKASGSGSILAAAKDSLLPQITSGYPAGPVFIADAGKNFPPAFARGYATAEEAGAIDEEMGRWSQVFADDAKTSIDNLVVWVPKIIYAMIVVLVVFQIFKMLGMYLKPIQDLMDQIP